VNAKSGVLLSAIVPTFPHPLFLSSEENQSNDLKNGYEDLRTRINELSIDLLLIYSTQWVSVLGHQIQGRTNLEDVFVDQDFHQLGSYHYKLGFHEDFAKSYAESCTRRGLAARVVNYQGFPIDSGTLTALNQLNPENKMSASLVSCNMYSDRSETVVLGKAALDAVKSCGLKVAAVAVTGLSRRFMPLKNKGGGNSVSLTRDQEWNDKIIEMLRLGRLEDVAQLARRFDKEARADQRFKAIWWLAALAGEHNRFKGTLHAYSAVQGCGSAVMSLEETDVAQGDLEFDEGNAEFYLGERSVLQSGLAK
jgi:2-aminophenol/2-amino-5-chlorophenol 1,6-dioxygenase subunit alpha